MITSPEDARRLQVVRVSVGETVFGVVFLTATVGATILLLVSVADGVIDAIGRWS